MFLQNKQKEGEESPQEEKEGESKEKGEQDEEKIDDEGDTEKKEDSKDAKTRMKDAMENIHMPKMPKMHKPSFMKKKDSTKEVTLNIYII